MGKRPVYRGASLTLAGLVRSVPRRRSHSGAEGSRDQRDEEHHRPGHPEAHLEIRVVHRHHDEVPEEHGDVGHQGTDSGHEPEEETDHEKAEEELDDDFHEMFDAFLSSGWCGFLSPT